MFSHSSLFLLLMVLATTATLLFHSLQLLRCSCIGGEMRTLSGGEGGGEVMHRELLENYTLILPGGVHKTVWLRPPCLRVCCSCYSLPAKLQLKKSFCYRNVGYHTHLTRWVKRPTSLLDDPSGVVPTLLAAPYISEACTARPGQACTGCNCPGITVQYPAVSCWLPPRAALGITVLSTLHCAALQGALWCILYTLYSVHTVCIPWLAH